MTKPTILVATWGDGLFALTGDGRTHEMANQPIRGLARMSAAAPSPLSAGIRCAAVLPAANGPPSRRARSSFRAVWRFETPSTLERTMPSCCG